METLFECIMRLTDEGFGISIKMDNGEKYKTRTIRLVLGQTSKEIKMTHKFLQMSLTPELILVNELNKAAMGIKEFLNKTKS